MIKHTIIFSCLFFLCALHAGPSLSSRKAQLLHPSGIKLNIDLLITPDQITKGVSGIKGEDFPENKGAFFMFKAPSKRVFWMPDTYFLLDIIFLNKDLKVLFIEKKMPYHPGFSKTPPIARTKEIFCHFVLEIKASSHLAAKIKVGDQFKWVSKPSLNSLLGKVFK